MICTTSYMTFGFETPPLENSSRTSCCGELLASHLQCMLLRCNCLYLSSYYPFNFATFHLEQDSYVTVCSPYAKIFGLNKFQFKSLLILKNALHSDWLIKLNNGRLEIYTEISILFGKFLLIKLDIFSLWKLKQTTDKKGKRNTKLKRLRNLF